MNMALVRKQRNLPFVKVGMRVFSLHYNKGGKILGANSSGNFNIKFDGDSFSQNCHPCWAIQYLDKDENIIAEYEK